MSEASFDDSSPETASEVDVKEKVLSQPALLITSAEAWLQALDDVQPFELIARGQQARHSRTDDEVIGLLRRRTALITQLLSTAHRLKPVAVALGLETASLERSALYDEWSLRPGLDLDGPAAYVVRQIKDWAELELMRGYDLRPLAEIDRLQAEVLCRAFNFTAIEAPHHHQSDPSSRTLKFLIADGHAPAGREVKVRSTYQSAQQIAEAHCSRNPFPGVNELARIVRDKSGRTCSKTTIRKAIDHSPKLRRMAAKHEEGRRSVSTRQMPSQVQGSVRQNREQDPAEQAATKEIIEKLMEESSSEERERLQNLSDIARRELVNAMDVDAIRALYRRKH